MNRPTVATVFGILNIAFGTLGVLCGPLSLLIFVMPGQERNPVVRLVHENGAFLAYTLTAACVGFLAAGALIAAGIGLLGMKPWARITSMAYGIVSIVMTMTGTVVNLFVLLPLIGESSGPEAAGVIGGVIGGSLGGCISLIYPTLLLIFMTRPSVRDAFRQQAQTVQAV